MRFAAIPLALLLAVPVTASAQQRGRPPPPSSQSADPAPATRGEPATSSRPARPPPPDVAPPRPPPDSVRPPPPVQGGPGGPGGPWIPPPPVYYPPPFWWGFGWGYGYYPLYPYYAEPAPGYAVPTTPAQQLAATVRATGAAGTGESGAAGMAFAMENSRGGFDLSVDAFAPSTGGVMTGGLGGQGDAYAFSTAHFAYPILEGPSYRLRLQAGGSWLSVPSSTAGPSTDAFGFDLGVSANFGLVGPLGVEGHAHFTPYPVPVIDLRAAVALRAGAFSLLGGYRVIDVSADSRTGPAARFEGPELGLGLIF